MDNLLTRLRAGDLEAERAVLAAPGRSLVLAMLSAAADHRPDDAADDAEIVVAILRARADRLMSRLYMPPRLCCSAA